MFTISDHNKYKPYAIAMAESEEEAKAKFIETAKIETANDVNYDGKPVHTFEEFISFYDIDHITEIPSGVHFTERSLATYIITLIIAYVKPLVFKVNSLNYDTN